MYAKSICVSITVKVKVNHSCQYECSQQAKSKSFFLRLSFLCRRVPLGLDAVRTRLVVRRKVGVDVLAAPLANAWLDGGAGPRFTGPSRLGDLGDGGGHLSGIAGRIEGLRLSDHVRRGHTLLTLHAGCQEGRHCPTRCLDGEVATLQ